MPTRILTPTSAALVEAALIFRGGIVALPTEPVRGPGASAPESDSVQRTAGGANSR